MSITILEPHEKEEVSSPVTVVAGYSFANTFNLTCTVGSTAESPKSRSGDGTHKSDPLSVSPGVYTVHADGDNSAGNAVQNYVTVTGGTLPIDDVEIKVEKPVEAGMKKVKVTGECDPKTKAAYVICRILEVNLKTGQRTRVAAGADTTEGKKLAWNVDVSFAANQARWIEYVAQITSYNLEDKPQGQITKHIKR
jgi:hypothetical protein